MKTFLRLATLLAVACGFVLVPSVAQAVGGCSTTKGVPNISVTYYYCSRYNDTTPATWDSNLNIINNHGANIVIYTEFQLKIDKNIAFDTISVPNQIGTGVTMFDPYNKMYITDIRQLYKNSCTKGHTYFPSARLMVDGFGWGPWAGGYQFVC